MASERLQNRCNGKTLHHKNTERHEKNNDGIKTRLKRSTLKPGLIEFFLTLSMNYNGFVKKEYPELGAIMLLF